jgi:hypothetical protein
MALRSHQQGLPSAVPVSWGVRRGRVVDDEERFYTYDKPFFLALWGSGSPAMSFETLPSIAE